MFSKILIANRGEIALRIARTCRAMGISPVSIYSKGEEELPHITQINEHYPLGEGALSDTYLNQEKIIRIAQECGAEAIHPGYGFLSENAEFCRKVTDAGLVFIGPEADIIQLMGDKITSRQAMQGINIPVIPGYNGDAQDIHTLKNKAREIGFPLLIKASAGGGGKGMRVVEAPSELDTALKAAKHEAQQAFGDDRVFLEKYITTPRHIEVQVFSDTHSNHVHMFERECSIQRRHQKILEETPSTALNDALRKKMTDTALQITRHIDYTGAGTIEFILDATEDFYFLEMNTRLQVEHPITEMVTGLDLVEWQIRVAQEEALPLQQNDITSRGHAIEVRIYAEDPENHFLPTTGIISAIGKVEGEHTRLECGYCDGNSVMTDYDPMLAKLIAWGETRQEAASCLEECLENLYFAGIKTNRQYLKHILVSEAFLAGETTTDFIEKNARLLAPPSLSDEQKARFLAGFLFAEATPVNIENSSLWETSHVAGFRNV